MALSTFSLSHFPDVTIHMISFKDVLNADSVLEELIRGNPDFAYAFIDGSMVLSPRSLISSIFRALTDWKANRLRTNNVHSEIVFCMNSNNNITESFRRFGLSATTSSLVAIKVYRNNDSHGTVAEQKLEPESNPEGENGSPTESEDEEEPPLSAEEVFTHLVDSIDGKPLDRWDQICEFTDLAKIRKAHKLPLSIPSSASASTSPSNQDVLDIERQQLEAVLMGMIAIRGG